MSPGRGEYLEIERAFRSLTDPEDAVRLILERIYGQGALDALNRGTSRFVATFRRVERKPASQVARG